MLCFQVVGLNFSSATTPELLLKTFDHYCEFRRTPNGLVLSPVQLNKWLVLFCDEINLPDMDTYGTQRVISFLRQMVEHGGFYRTSDQVLVYTSLFQPVKIVWCACEIGILEILLVLHVVHLTSALDVSVLILHKKPIFINVGYFLYDSIHFR